MALVLATGGYLDTDDETAELLLKLQLEDLDGLIEQSNPTGKGKEGVLTDIQLAFKLEKDELTKNLQVLQDRKMTRSIARAVQTDAALLAVNNGQERTAASDRAMACRLAGIPAPKAICAAPASSTCNGQDLELIDKLGALYVDHPYGDTASTTDVSVASNFEYGDAGESSAWAASRQVVKVERRECIMCAEEVPFFEIARLDCNHECCKICLIEMFKASIVNEARYPPKCCEVISPHIDNVRIFLPSTIVKEFDVKKIEWDTKNRVYCSNRQCLAFIPSKNIVADHASCSICNSMTCAICKKADHEGMCPEDKELKRTLQLIEQEGWRRCATCNLGFDLYYGCNHITCQCRSEFCYVCESAWKSCKCPVWMKTTFYSGPNVLPTGMQT